MEYKKARDYCVMLLLCRKAIDKAIVKARNKTTRKQVKMLRELYTDFNPDEDSMFKASRQELPYVDVRWGMPNDTFRLERPEAWLQCFREALVIYKSIFGKKKYSMLAAHFTRNVDVQTLAVRHKITRSAIYQNFNTFKDILLVVAAQKGLLTIEPNKAQDEQEGEKQDA